MSNNIDELRGILFDAIRNVRDGKLDLDKARTINEMSRTLIDTARVEVSYIQATGEGASTFLPKSDAGDQPQPSGDEPANGITGIVRHRLRG